MSSTQSTTGSSDESAQVSELAGDGLHLGCDDGGEQLLEAVDGLGGLDAGLLVLGNVGLVQLVHPVRLGVNQVVDFLRSQRGCHQGTGIEGSLFTEEVGMGIITRKGKRFVIEGKKEGRSALSL